MTQFRARTPSGELVGSVIGAGPQVLLLHGGPGLSDYLGPLAAELCDSYTVATYTQRGLAPSTVAGPTSVAAHGADVVTVADHLGWDRPIIGGHSWGGHLVLHGIADHPERWRAALVVDPLGAIGDGGMAEFEETLAQRVPAANRPRVAELEAVEAESGWLSPELHHEHLGLVWPAYFPDPVQAPPMPRIEVAVAQDHMWEDIVASLPRLRAGLTGCAVPTVFVHGELSPMPVTASTASAEVMLDASVDIVPGAGHFIWVDVPGAVRRSLDRLVQELDRSRA